MSDGSAIVRTMSGHDFDGELFNGLAPLAPLEGLNLPDDDDFSEGIVPTALAFPISNQTVVHAELAPSAKKQKTRACNPCSQCKIQHYPDVPGHTKFGWCPTMHSFTLRSNDDKTQSKEQGEKTSCGKRLRDLMLDLTYRGDEGAMNFLQNVRCSQHVAVRNQLVGSGGMQARSELMLLPVATTTLHAPLGSPQWKWSVLSEATRRMPAGDAPPECSATQTLKVLLEQASKMLLELDHRELMRKSDSMATCMHEAVWRGSRTAVSMLLKHTLHIMAAKPEVILKYDGQLGLWATTRSGYLPFHNAFNRNAPAYFELATLLPWLLEQMDMQLKEMKSSLKKFEGIEPRAASYCNATLCTTHSCVLPASAVDELRKIRLKVDVRRELRGDGEVHVKLDVKACSGPPGFKTENGWEVNLFKDAIGAS